MDWTGLAAAAAVIGIFLFSHLPRSSQSPVSPYQLYFRNTSHRVSPWPARRTTSVTAPPPPPPPGGETHLFARNDDNLN